MKFDPSDTLIWSADVDLSRPDKVVDRIAAVLAQHPGIKLVKVDQAAVATVPNLVRELTLGYGVRVFDDQKVSEIPEKAEGLGRHYGSTRPWMLNCMAGITSTGRFGRDVPLDQRDGLRRFADACLEAGILPCVVTVLTSKTPEQVASEFNGRKPVEQVLAYLDMAVEAGFTDAVCSPQEVAAIREYARFDALSLNTPGIRPLGTAANDQARVGTPAATLLAGATRLVVGRPILQGHYDQIASEISATSRPEETP